MWLQEIPNFYPIYKSQLVNLSIKFLNGIMIREQFYVIKFIYIILWTSNQFKQWNTISKMLEFTEAIYDKRLFDYVPCFISQYMSLWYSEMYV